MRAIAAVAIVPPLLKVVKFTWMVRMLTTLARVGVGVARAPDDEVTAKWVDRVLFRLPRPWTHTCLRRASVLYFLLRGAGRPVDLCIGVRRDAHGELLAHAWLVRDGHVYLERGRSSEQVAEFQLIAQFP